MKAYWKIKWSNLHYPVNKNLRALGRVSLFIPNVYKIFFLVILLLFISSHNLYINIFNSSESGMILSCFSTLFYLVSVHCAFKVVFRFGICLTIIQFIQRNIKITVPLYLNNWAQSFLISNFFSTFTMFKNASD